MNMRRKHQDHISINHKQNTLLESCHHLSIVPIVLGIDKNLMIRFDFKCLGRNSIHYQV